MAIAKSCFVPVVFLFLALLHGVAGQTVVRRVGETASFTNVPLPSTGRIIVTTAQGDDMLRLDFFDRVVLGRFQGRVTITDFDNDFNNPSFSFTMASVTRADAGTFQCISQFGQAQACGSATLVVVAAPTKPVLTVETQRIVVGNEVIMECRSTSTTVPNTGYELRYNLKENGRLALSTPTRQTRFRIGAVTKAKTGFRYTCVAYEVNLQTNQLTGLASADSDAFIMNPLYPPDTPVLTPPNNSYEVSSGTVIADVTCTADCRPLCSFDWFKEGQIYQAGATLTLGSVDSGDAGNYFCRANNTVGSKDAPLLVSVQDRVSPPELTPPGTQYTVREGVFIDDIVCSAQCTPACTYAWFKDGQRVSDSDRLSLATVTSQDSGTYTCQASNGQDTVETSITVDVQYPPKKRAGRELISPSSTEYTVEEGALVLPDIICDADCNPVCSVKWTEAGVGQAGSGGTLSLGTAGREDTGQYSCTASNSLGQLAETVTVDIQFKPEQVTFTPPALQYETVENVDVIPDIQCAAICNPECRYGWILESNRTLVSNTPVLSLGAARREQSGSYMCMAVNPWGEDVKRLNVVVDYGPDRVVLTPPRDSYTIPSGSILPPVTCSADCSSPCDIRWVKDDGPVPITTSSTLTLGRADRSTSGIYKCVASNAIGSANAKFDLTVQFGPNSTLQLQPPDSSHDLSEGDDLTVTCSATCDPACSFRWEDNSGREVSGDATLRLSDVTRSSAGRYTCVADNGVGVPGARTISVNVLIGPSGKVTITPPLPVIPLKEGNSIVLTCAAECSPLCTLGWRKGAVGLTSSNGLLTLNDVTRTQDGTYTCEASNDVGTDSKSVTLEIQYGPGNSLSFEPEPDKGVYSVDEGEQLSVTCSADCKPECAYLWTRGAGIQVSTSAELSLTSVQRAQAGILTCTANNGVNQPATKTATLDVQYGPGEIRLFPDEEQLYPVKGSSVSIKCWADCNPLCKLVWFKGSLLLPNATEGELDLRNVTTADSGNYVCVAANDVKGPATRTVEVNVRAGPGTTIRFSPPDDVAVVSEGRQFQVTCIAECSPLCSYEWRKGSQLITDQSTLIFPVTNRSMAGGYICFASNDANSQASKPLSLEVQYGPGDSIALFPPGKNQSYVEGAPFSIKCTAECGPPCTFQWFLGPTLLSTQDGILSSDSAQQDQAGTYTCQATNGVGSTSYASVVVDIQTGPGRTLTFTPPGRRQVVREGEDLQVRCSADCVPACAFRWLYEGEEVTTAPPPAGGQGGDGGLLALTAVTRGQMGTYTCVADNGLGNQGSQPLTLQVQYGPEGSVDVFPNASVHVLNEGGSLSLKCSADCSPLCEYGWYHGNDVLTAPGGVLALVAVGPENAGTYRCSASNTIGLASSDDVTVVVKTGPGNSVKIEPEGEVYNVTKGQQLRLKCSAMCSPPCTYTWYYGFQREKRDDGVLVIDDVMRNVSGPFVCSAANDVGLKGSKMVKVNVLYGPVDGIALDPADNVTVVLDQPFTLRCSADCLPFCTYQWFLGPLPTGSAGGKLTVRRAGLEDAGSYTCRANNAVGSTMSDAVLVDVHYGPRDTITLEPEGPMYQVKEGDDVIVTCSADCKPECTYAWYAGADPVMSEGGRLVLPNYSRSMPRFFSCFADNGLTARAAAPLQIDVQYGPGERAQLFPTTSPLTTTVGGAVSVQCTADCSPECTYTWSKDGEVVYTREEGVLELLSVTGQQAGKYVCTADNNIDQPATASVDIDVLSGQGATIRFVPPGLTAEVEAGTTFRVACTANCVPECKFFWTRDGARVSGSSLLVLQEPQREDSGVFQCHALNDLGVNVTQQLSLTVQHGPRGSIRLFPPESTRNLNRGDTLTVQCSALCYPECVYQWRKGAEVLATEEGVLLVPRVTPEDSGRYTCTASNDIGDPDTTSLALNVNFGPEDTITFDPPGDSQSILEGDTLRVLCGADCLPECSFTWYVGSRRLVSQGGMLELDDVTRDDAGTYTCHADNGVGRRMTQDLLVDVLYPPSTPILEPPMTSYTVVEGVGSVSDIRCSAACNPRCDLQWLKDGTPMAAQGNVLVLNSPDRSADGVYSCVASNDHGSRQIDVTVRVNYPPTISVFAINDQRVTATVNEKFPVTLTCRVSSQPTSSVSLFNGSRLLQETQDILMARYQWRQAECLDSGQYSCQADNGVGDTATLTAQLRVLCAPRLDPRVFWQPYVASGLGERAVLEVVVLADPPPSFFWYKVRQGGPIVMSVAGNGGGGSSDKFFTVNGTTSRLTLASVQLSDFGDYMVTMVNSKGSNNYTMSLVPQSAPYPAQGLAARSVGGKTVEVTWSPGFNGGSTQQFLLEYRRPGTKGWLILELDSALDDLTPLLSVNVTDLSPSSRYLFRMRSRNVHGYSNYTDPVAVATKDSQGGDVASGDVSHTPVLMGVGLALGFLVGAGITAIVIVSRCRPQPRKTGENTIDDFRSDTTYDTLYLRDALWAQRHIKMRQNGGGSISGMDGYDYKQPEDTVRGYNDYTSSLKPVSEMQTSL